jgi:hypothetical protein
MILKEWHLPSNKKLNIWVRAFLDNDSEEVFHLSVPCPLCGVSALHQWYFVGRRSEAPPHFWRGSVRLWCSACRAMAHLSCQIPDWWLEKMQAQTDSPKLYPTSFDEAIKWSLIGFEDKPDAGDKK